MGGGVGDLKLGDFDLLRRERRGEELDEELLPDEGPELDEDRFLFLPWSECFLFRFCLWSGEDDFLELLPRRGDFFEERL